MRHDPAQIAHLPHVELSGQSMHDAACPEKQQGLEEGMGHEVEDARGKGTDARGKKHVAKLADGRVGQNPLDVKLGQTDRSRIDCGEGADDGHDPHGDRGQHIKGTTSGHHVHPGRDHGGRMDQGTDRRGAFHGVRQPDVKGNLRRFPYGTHE